MSPKRRKATSSWLLQYHSSGKQFIKFFAPDFLYFDDVFSSALLPAMPPACNSMVKLSSACFPCADDEDYLPPGSPPQPKKFQSRSKKQQDRVSSEEDVSLAKRRESLHRQKATSATAALAGLTASRIRQHVPDLPEEVIHNILLQASKDGGAVPIAPTIACVCRSWSHALATCPSELWAKVDLSFGWCRPTNAILEAHSPKWRSMRSLNLSGCGAVNESGLAAIAENCPLVHTLDLSSCTGIREEGLSNVLCTMLLRPEITEVSSPLRNLNLSFIEVLPKMSGLDAVLKKVMFGQANNPQGPVLERLIVEGCPTLTHRPFRAICDLSASGWPKITPLLRALKHLSLAHSAGACGGFTLNMVRLQLAAPNLEYLDLSYVARALGWSVGTPAGLPEGAARAACWRHLHTCKLTNFEPHARAMFDTKTILGQILKRAAKLEDLSLIGFTGRLYWDELGDVLSAPGVDRSLGLDNGNGLRRLTLDGTSSTFGHQRQKVPDLCDLFGRHHMAYQMLEELSVVNTKEAMTDEVCELLGISFEKLLRVDARETAITDKGVRWLLEGAKERGCLDRFSLDIASCRGVERSVRQAASRGMKELVEALHIV